MPSFEWVGCNCTDHQRLACEMFCTADKQTPSVTASFLKNSRGRRYRTQKVVVLWIWTRSLLLFTVGPIRGYDRVGAAVLKQRTKNFDRNNYYSYFHPLKLVRFSKRKLNCLQGRTETADTGNTVNSRLSVTHGTNCVDWKRVQDRY